MRRHRRLGALVLGLALIGLFTGVLAKAASLPAHAASANAAGPPVLTWSPTNSIGAYDYGTLDAGAGATKAVTFTLTNSGDRAPGALTIMILPPGSSAFTITADSCTGTSIGPNPPDNSCSVTVQYAPTTSGQSDTVTLAADSKKASTSITLTGKSGTPDLTLSPGTLGTNTHFGTGKDPNGTKSYNYNFGFGSSATTEFTVTNIGNGTSNTLQLAGLQQPFTLSSDQTSGHTLAPGGTSKFTLTAAPGVCSTPELFATPLLVTSTTASPYISVIYSASCGTPITSVTATLSNLTFPGNPEPVSSSSRSLALIGTLKNVNFKPPAPPPAGVLHGFTIQIPFSLTAGTLNCDMSASYQPGTCSVSNNVLTVTQNFLIFRPPLLWIPGHSQGIGYVYVGSSLPLGAFVTLGTPIVTAVN